VARGDQATPAPAAVAVRRRLPLPLPHQRLWLWLGAVALLLVATAGAALLLVASQTSSDPTIKTVAGGSAGGGLVRPSALALDQAGTLYVVDGSQVRKLTSSGQQVVVAGTKMSGFAGDGGPATAAELDQPQGIAIDSSGNLYIADTLNSRVRRVDSAGIISTVAGTGAPGDSGDGGPAALARLMSPLGLAIGPDDGVFIADYGANRVRELLPNGTIVTVAGTGDPGYAGDGELASAALLNGPQGLAFDSEGNLYIADSQNDRVRAVDAAGVITTVAGSGSEGEAGDGAPAVGADLRLPTGPLDGAGGGLAVDAAGNLFIADSFNNRVREVSVDGRIRTVAGSGSAGYSGDGDPAVTALLHLPLSVAVDLAGDLFVADTANSRIREVPIRPAG
jgi:sugar lactone lactonase YvrE